jgi:prepilin-type N-terminal cleavage/methylation domain-containing protein
MMTKQSEAGFTLVEVLVSLALLSVLSIYSLSAFRLQKDLDHVESDISRRLEISAAMEAMQKQLSSMQLVFMPDQNGQNNLVFEGEPHRIVFAALSDGSQIEGGLYRATMEVNDAHQLLATLEALKAKGFGPKTTIAMLDRVDGLNFGYAALADSSSHLEEWVAKDQLPSSVEVKIVLESRGEQSTPAQSFTVTANVELAN